MITLGSLDVKEVTEIEEFLTPDIGEAITCSLNGPLI